MKIRSFPVLLIILAFIIMVSGCGQTVDKTAVTTQAAASSSPADSSV